MISSAHMQYLPTNISHLKQFIHENVYHIVDIGIVFRVFEDMLLTHSTTFIHIFQFILFIVDYVEQYICMQFLYSILQMFNYLYELIIYAI